VLGVKPRLGHRSSETTPLAASCGSWPSRGFMPRNRSGGDPPATQFEGIMRFIVFNLLATLVARGTAAQAPAARSGDTIRIEVGSPEVDGRIYRPHAARVRVRVGDSNSRVVSEWTNELTLGDSAGRPVMRWVTTGTQFPESGAPVTWELRQTYDAVTLAPYSYHRTTSTGGETRLTLDGRRVHGTRRAPGNATAEAIDATLDRPGFFAGASDLVPPAVRLQPGVVMTAPVWSPAMSRSELRIFSVIAKDTVDVEGSAVEAWKVEERRADGALQATWWLLERSPYMVYGEVVLPNGQVQRMTEVEIPGSHH
jgi:hypothetical protein